MAFPRSKSTTAVKVVGAVASSTCLQVCAACGKQSALEIHCRGVLPTSVTLLHTLCACEGTWISAVEPGTASQLTGSLGKEWELAAVSPESRKECEVCRWLDLEAHTQDVEMFPSSVSEPRVSALVPWVNDLQVPRAGWMVCSAEGLCGCQFTVLCSVNSPPASASSGQVQCFTAQAPL